MSRNKVYAIVEGHGEANSPYRGVAPAVMVLIQRMLQYQNCWTLFPGTKYPPFRMRSYGAFFAGDTFERAVRYHKGISDCAAVLVLLDMDDDCAKARAVELASRVKDMEALPFSVVVVAAKREYEAWFLASLETIKDEVYGDDPEHRRDVKGWLKKQYGYRPTRHQAEYTQLVDIDLARARSRSFRRLCHAFEEVKCAQQDSHVIISP